MSLIKGDIVLVPFPFTDLSQTKLRPAVVLHVGRTNGAGDDGNLLGFTTILVRTGSTIEDNRVVNKNECVPFALVDRLGNNPELRVITNAPSSNNIGTNTVLRLDRADKPAIYN